MSQDLENVTSKEVRDRLPPAHSRPKPLTYVCLARFPQRSARYLPVFARIRLSALEASLHLPCGGTRAVEDPGLELDFSLIPEIMSRLSALSEPWGSCRRS